MRPRGRHRGGKRRTGKRFIGLIVAAVALLALPASAQALTLSGLAAAPVNNQGGAHSDFNIHMDFGDGQVKDLTVGLPPGLIGDPNAAPLCTVDQLNADACAADTKVGRVVANATVTVAILPVTLNVRGDLYNLTPQPGEPARFGIVLRPIKGDLCELLPAPLCALIPNLLPPVILQSGVQLRPDFGLDTVINNIPNSTSGLPTTINSQDITLFGTAPGTGKPFMRNPTSCPGPHTTNFTAVPYTGATATGTAEFSTTNCGALDFSPTLTATVGGAGQTTNGVPTTVITSIDQEPAEAGLLKAQVTVPADFTPNPIPLAGACSQAEFAAGTCGAGAQVGSAVAGSPLLSQALTGPVYLVNTDPPGPFPNVGLDLQGQLHLKLQGTLDINKTTTFDNLPDIPIAHFALAFTPQPGLLQTARDICLPPAPNFHADFTGYNGGATTMDAAATVVGCGPGSGTGTKGKCKKAKKKHKKKHRAAEAKKKHKKKKSCKKKRKKHKKRH